jgi:hypothetical protein
MILAAYARHLHDNFNLFFRFDDVCQRFPFCSRLRDHISPSAMGNPAGPTLPSTLLFSLAIGSDGKEIAINQWADLSYRPVGVSYPLTRSFGNRSASRMVSSNILSMSFLIPLNSLTILPNPLRLPINCLNHSSGSPYQKLIVYLSIEQDDNHDLKRSHRSLLFVLYR